MLIIKSDLLPTTEANLRLALAEYKNALSDFPMTVDEPAPFPDFDIIYAIVDDPDQDFIVKVDTPRPDPKLYISVENPDGTWAVTPRDPAVIITEQREAKVAGTKAEAQRRIFARYPQYKQANMQARHAEILAIESGHYRDQTGALQAARSVTAAENAELASFCVAWVWVKSVRTASDLIEADIAISADPANFDVVNSPRWPA